MPGDYLHDQHQFGEWVVDIVLDGTAISATTPTNGAALSANHTIYVQRIVWSITTHVNAKSLTIQDSNSSPKIIANHQDVTATAGQQDVFVWDFGPRGVPLTEGKSLQYVANAGGSGSVGIVHIEGYQVRTKTAAA